MEHDAIRLDEFLYPASVDQKLISDAIKSVYRKVGLPKPDLVWFDSIYAVEFCFQILVTDQMENTLMSDPLENAADPEYQFMIDYGSFINLPNNWGNTKFSKRDAYEWLGGKGSNINIVSGRFMEFIQNGITCEEGVILDEKRWLKDSILPLMHNSGGVYCMPKPLLAENIFSINPLIDQLNFINRSCFCWYPFDQLVFS